MGWESCKPWITQPISTLSCMFARMLMTWKRRLTLHIFPCCFWLVSSMVGIEQYGLPPGDKTTPTSSAWKGERSIWMQTMLRGGQQSIWWKGKETTWHHTWALPTILAARLAREQEGSAPPPREEGGWPVLQTAVFPRGTILDSWFLDQRVWKAQMLSQQPCYASTWEVGESGVQRQSEL